MREAVETVWIFENKAQNPKLKHSQVYPGDLMTSTGDGENCVVYEKFGESWQWFLLSSL